MHGNSLNSLIIFHIQYLNTPLDNNMLKCHISKVVTYAIQIKKKDGHWAEFTYKRLLKRYSKLSLSTSVAMKLRTPF